MAEIRKKKETRGRKSKITAALTKSICDYLELGVDQKTACNLAGIPYSTYNEWKIKGDKGIQPFAQFFSITSRTRKQRKLKLVKIVHAASMGELPRTADWRAASFLLERGWPLEFAPVYREQVTPAKADESKKVSVAFIFETNGKTIEELTNFPVYGDLTPTPDTPEPEQAARSPNQSRPIVGVGGKVRGWTDEPLPQDGADADNDLP